jgi:hypothetical protein
MVPMRGVAWLMALAACGSSTGVDIEITSDVPITNVEVFVGNGLCLEESGACAGGVAWLPNQQPPMGTTYVTWTQNASKIETRLVPEPDGSRYVIRLTADSEYAEPLVIAVVGFDGSEAVALGTVWRQRIPVNSAEHWVVHLAPADKATAAMGPPQPEAPQTRVFVWGREGTTPEQEAGARCLVFQNWDGSSWKSSFIVPDSDRDCDGEIPELECDDRYFNLNQDVDPLGTPEPTRCLDVVTSSSGSNNIVAACALGHTRCEDGVDPDPTCSLTANQGYTCVPDRLCEICGGPYGLAPCLSTSVRRYSSEISHAECGLKGDAVTGAACGMQRDGYHAQLTLPFPCPAIDLVDADMPFGPTYMLPYVPIEQAQVEVHRPDAGSCVIDVYFKGGMAQLGSRHWFLLSVYPFAFDASKRVIVPLRIEFTASDDCTLASTVPTPCKLSDAFQSDNMLLCGGVMPWPMP